VDGGGGGDAGRRDLGRRVCGGRFVRWRSGEIEPVRDLRAGEGCIGVGFGGSKGRCGRSESALNGRGAIGLGVVTKDDSEGRRSDGGRDWNR
jgi:hypothetical protein